MATVRQTIKFINADNYVVEVWDDYDDYDLQIGDEIDLNDGEIWEVAKISNPRNANYTKVLVV